MPEAFRVGWFLNAIDKEFIMNDELELAIVELGDAKEVTLGFPGAHIEDEPEVDLED